MKLSGRNLRKLNNIAIIIFGLLSFVCSFVLVWGGGVQSDEFERWQAAPLIQGTDELHTVGAQNDITIVGSIDPETPASAEGLAIYEYWETKSQGSGSRRRLVTEHIYARDHKPAFQLLFDGQTTVTVQSEHAILDNTRDVMISGRVRHHGFSPGDDVTVFGTMLSASAPFEVQADIICGGSHETCLESQAKSIIGFYTIAAILILVGGGLLALLGLRRRLGR